MRDLPYPNYWSVIYSGPDYWIWTASGKSFSYNYTDPSQITIEDIAESLSSTRRFAGHTKPLKYCVADHCCNLVEHMISKGYDDPYVLLGVLLHDAAEAYLGDVPAPAKKLLPDFKRLEKHLYGIIADKFGVPNDAEFHKILDYYDKNIVRDEAEKLFNNCPEWTKEYTKLGAEIVVSGSDQIAYDRYMQLFNELNERINAREW
jgi:5'-deoxynucleotidase YfbR-like HD superfamily hydrolase